MHAHEFAVQFVDKRFSTSPDTSALAPYGARPSSFAVATSPSIMASKFASRSASSTPSSPRRVWSTTMPSSFASRTDEPARLAHGRDGAASRRLARREQVLIEVDEDDDARIGARAATPLQFRRRRARAWCRGSSAAVTSLTGRPSCAATSRARVVTPTLHATEIRRTAVATEARAHAHVPQRTASPSPTSSSAC